MDLEQAERFLGYFNYENFTFQYLKNGRPAGYLCVHETEFDFLQLAVAHQEGKEIFFMVNEGDGIIYPNKKIPRSKQNVQRLTSLFIDTDDIPLNRVKSFLKETGLKPHLVVETSPKKYHLYFLLSAQDERLYRSNQEQWETFVSRWSTCQLQLACLGEDSPQTDSSVKDVARVLRVPGFYHLKNQSAPFLTRIRQEYRHQKYSLSEIEKKLQKVYPRAVNHTRGSHSVHPGESGYQLPAKKVNQGNRHSEMSRHLGYLLQKGVDPDIAIHSFYSLAQNHFHNGHEFLPGGQRNKEVTDFVRFKLDDMEQESTSQRENLRTELLQRADAANPFDLPDDFYLQAPGLIGEITKEITKTALYPLPAINFAQALAGLGTIKAAHYRTELGHVPANYFMCLAPTGHGKSYPQRVISHTFKSLGIHPLIMAGVRSEKGIARFMEENESLGLIQLDESEDFFRVFTDKNAPQYLRACKDMLLQAYSSHDDPYKSLGKTGDKREKEIILRYPRLNFIAYGVPHLIETTFNEKLIADGLMQRFIIISCHNEKVENTNSLPPTSLNGHIYSHLEEILLQSRHFREKVFIEMRDLTTEYESVTDEKEKAQILTHLSKLQDITHDRQQHTLKFNPLALKQFKAFQHELNQLTNKENNLNTGLAGLYTRGAEQVGRLLAVSCGHSSPISTDDTEYFITFIRSRINALKTSCTDMFTRSSISRDMDKLQHFIAKHADTSGICSYRKIIRNFKVRDSRELKSLLFDAVDAGLLNYHPNYSKSSTGHGRKGDGYSVGDL